MHLPSWAWSDCACFWRAAELGLCDRLSVFCHVLLTHQPGACPAGHLTNWKETKAYKNDVHLLPQELDERVARSHLPRLLQTSLS